MTIIRKLNLNLTLKQGLKWLIAQNSYICGLPSFGGFVKNVKIISIESDFGAGKRGAKLGPQALIKQLQKINPDLLSTFSQVSVVPDDLEGDETTNFAKSIDAILGVKEKSIKVISDALEANEFPIVFSGDHSNGLAGISALKNQYPDKKIGVIWIDAHADLHTPYTSPSGNMHGMPLAAALGIGSNKTNKNKVEKEVSDKWTKLIQLGDKNINPKLDAAHLVFIDLRDLEDEEIEVLSSHQIKYYTPKDRKEAGLDFIITETLAHLKECDLLLVSFDVDSLDPSNSYGTGTPVAGGLSKEEAIELLSAFWVQPKLALFEITEINPLLDRYNPMEEVAAEIMEKLLAKGLA